MLPPGGVLPWGVSAPGGAGEDPPGRLLLRAVRILLECSLVIIIRTKLLVFDYETVYFKTQIFVTFSN